MANKTPSKNATTKDAIKKPDHTSQQDCPDDFRAKPDLDGKNDSGPDPEVHGKEIPPQ